MIVNELSLYLHWPFCVSKCPYCDFVSVPKNAKLNDEDYYVNSLITDFENSISEIDANNYIVKTIFFGGGTPSLLSEKSVEKILLAIDKKCKVAENAEISLEANPATFDNEKIKNFKKLGVNRLSLGIQSFDEENLKFLGRIYSAKNALKAAEIIANNFENYSFDFMYGYETQSNDSFENDLKIAMNFACEHISCYQLTFEENTPFYQKLIKNEITEIDENSGVFFYDFIAEYLQNYNIYRYEISNYSKRGSESIHNLAYWNYKDYLGVGASAHSRLTIDGKKYEISRLTNIANWATAISNNKSPLAVKKILSDEEQIEEIILMGLRLNDGVCLQKLSEKFSIIVVKKIINDEKISFLKTQKLIENIDDKIKLTEDGRIKINAVINFLFI